MPPRPSDVKNVNNITTSPSPGGATLPAAELPAGNLAYAVRYGGIGEVYDDYAAARQHYHVMRRLGLHPVLAIRQSLTAAVTFVEEGTGHRPPNAAQREHWIQEELDELSLSSEEESDLTYTD
ncbi:hypothetical protein B0H12DRAFT_1245539 [Mycena haematopus]|nr:hypothetical protein B0H12DRAFT_1245539 [Mycena haematopus]